MRTTSPWGWATASTRPGPVTDGVTPLGWAFALAPFAAGGPLAALAAAKALGALAWTLAAGVLALAIDRASARPARFAALALVPASAPLAAWSVAGMETGVVAALGALAVALPALGRALAGAACAGAAAALRPELLPFALVVALSAQAAPRRDAAGGAPRPAWARALAALALAGLPFVAVAVARLSIFGRAAPLAALAKAPDAALGARYALACFLLTGPAALIAPAAWRALPAWPRGLLAAVAVHFLAVAAAGGDWMPLSRLVVPALPAVVLAAAHVASVAHARATALRLALALAGELFVMVRVGPTAARVGGDRLRVVEELRGALAGAEVVAALDIGWLGAATGATLVDLAGVTDPAIAALPGGHTTKRIPGALLDARRVDALVLLLAEGEAPASPWPASRFARGVEQRVARLPGAGDAFAPVAVSGVPHLRYVVLRRRAGGADAGEAPVDRGAD
ncbi:putative membrane protein [Sorangium cellulosum So ce56]|uniref:Membrane protein n=1 Tax=Sorangium cellulosum (strain So ce56) TaxID=448385 RepID=A9GSK8_SORC5|nr:putative membrane protein [Sorangium cellulosum So ce56]